MNLLSFAQEALDSAVTTRGVTYADARVVELQSRSLSTRNGRVGSASSGESLGCGIRVAAHGAWGFASTADLSREGLARAAHLAAEIAHASALALRRPVLLAREPAHKAVWKSEWAKDPLAMPVGEQLAYLLRVDEELRRVRGVTLAGAQIECWREHKVFVSSEGAEIDQTRTVMGAGCEAYSFRDGDIQKRSYPNSFGGQYQLGGWELVEQLDLLGHAARVAEEAVALHSAAQCPEFTGTLILDSSQLGLQIHESIGHPIELDRVLGSEANYAGMSFLTLDQLRALRYGSEVVNVVCDARVSHGPGMGTIAFDDEGVEGQCTPIITDGQFTGYMTSRETAAAVGEGRSNGCMRASSWNRLPLIRMTNVSLLPGGQSLEELFDVESGIYMETNRSWSIDDKRYNFQFGCEMAWEIKNGKKVRMLKNPTYSGISTEFWNSCDAVAGREHWTLWGVPNCGKGQPEQVMGTGHGASPARFRNVKVGGGYGR